MKMQVRGSEGIEHSMHLPNNKRRNKKLQEHRQLIHVYRTFVTLEKEESGTEYDDENMRK